MQLQCLYQLTNHWGFTKAPPLFPGLTAASVCIKDSSGKTFSFLLKILMFLALALTIPAVTVEVKLKGLPTASTQSPNLTSSELPN